MTAVMRMPDFKRIDAAGSKIDAALAGAVAIANDWPEPTPLPDELPPVMPFDPALLPEALRGWIMDISHRMQCPPDFSAVAAVAALSSLIGARAVVKPKARDDWAVMPNLWALAIGRPGVMKSPAISEVLKPLHRLQADERKRWEAALQEWELDSKVAELASADREKNAKKAIGTDKAKAKELLRPDQVGQPEPTKREFIVNDATVEAFQEVLAVNPWGTLAYRDEIYGLLTGLDKPGQEGSRSFYLTGYDGDKGHTTLRVIRGETYIKRVCIAMLGGIQPSRIRTYVRGAVEGGAADDGLLQRFGLAVWPDVAPEFVYVDQWSDTPSRQQANAVFDRLALLQPDDEDPQVWRFSAEAQEVFIEWYTASRQELKRGELHPAMESHLSKYAKLIPALALIFALVDAPDGANVIHEREFLRALAWGDYLRSHAERLYSAASRPETAGASTLLTKVIAGKLTDRDGVIADGFTPRQIAMKHWAGLSSPDDVRKAADLLVDFDWLRRECTTPGPSGGRPSERYLINPAALRNGGTP